MSEIDAGSIRRIFWITLVGIFVIVLVVFVASAFMSTRRTNPEKNSVGERPVVLRIPTAGPIPTATSTPTPTITPTPTPTVIPVSIHIPKLAISTVVEQVGVTKEGNMDTPTNAKHVGWFQYGTVPGRPGNAVMSGHYDTVTGKPAIFYKLYSIAVGDTVEIVLSNGQKQNFTVTGKELVPNDKFPLNYVFRDKAGTNVNLITCGGTWNAKEKNYTKRVVVYTTLTGESTAHTL